MLPAEPLKAVKEMSDLLYKANVSFWKLKDQMVAAEVPGANQADWSEDLIVLAVVSPLSISVGATFFRNHFLDISLGPQFFRVSFFLFLTHFSDDFDLLWLNEERHF